jgi:peptide/nickel transport system permease protein
MKKALYRLTANKLAFISGVIVLLLVLSAVLAPIISPFNPLKDDIGNRFLKPFTSDHILGTDEMGRDILSRIIFGGRVSLLVGLESVLFAFFAGSIPAIFAGFFGGKTEFVVMRFVDILFAIPSLILALSIVGLLGRSMVAVSIAIGLAYTPVFARVTYSSVVAIRNQGYVEAARALGTNPLKIIARDIFPNVLPLILVQAEAGLGFIGLGVNPPTPSWGLMLSSARTYIMEEPSMSISPGIAILITVFAFNLFGDGLRDLLDPRAWQAGE